MRKYIDIDDKLINEAMKITNKSTKKETVEVALRELIAAAKRKRMIELRGKVKWKGDLTKLRRW